MRRDAFQAIADPTRREILGIVANRSLNINALTENFDVSRTAIYKHIKILAECGMIVVKQQGRERYCEARMEKLQEVSHWVAQYIKHRYQQLNELDIYLKELKATKTQKSKIQKTDLNRRKKSSKKRRVAVKH